MIACGEVLAGKYRALRMLGEGGFGVVLEAEHLGHGGRVAIKLLRPELALEEPIVARFLREARALASLRGEHVARILDVASAPGEPFIVMEYLKGNDLGKLVASRGALPVAAAVDHVLQACTAIAEAHALGIVHRDIKPSNLFLTTRPDGSACIKVLDFGIAKAITPAEAPASITRTQDVIGTPLYMAPEQMRSAKIVDRRTDVWALGATLYELIAGKPAFGGATISEIYAMVLTDPPAPLPAEIPAPLVAAILRCLEKKPQHRFADVASFAAAIAPYASSRHVAPLATFASIAPLVLPETVSAQHHTVALGTIATTGRRTRTPLLGALAVVAALGAFLAIPRVEAAPAAARRTAVVEAPRLMTTPDRSLAPMIAPPPKRVTKSRKTTEAAKPAPEPEVVVSTPAPAPRGVATSRFE